MPAAGFYPSNAIPNRTVALNQVDSVYLDADAFLMERDILQAVDQSWDDKNFVSFLELSARVSNASTFYNYEQGLLFRAPKVATRTAGAAASTITLTSDSYITTQSLTGAVDRSPLVVGKVVEVADGLHALVTAKGNQGGASTTFALTRVEASGDLGAALQKHIDNGWPIVPQTSAYAEGTDAPDEGLDTPATRFRGQFQIIKSFTKMTGDAASLKMEVSFGGKNYYWDKSTTEMLTRHRIEQNNALMIGVGGANSVTDAAGKPVTFTNSLRSNLKALGNQLYYNGTTGFALADLDQLAARIKDVTGDTEVHWFIGPDLRIQVENLIRAFTVNGGIEYNSFANNSNGLSGRDRAINLGFDSFHYHGVTFHLQEYRVHPVLMNQPFQTYRQEGYIVPAKMISFQAPTDTNGIERVTMPSLSLRYRVQSNGVSRRFMEVMQDINTNVNMNDSIKKLLQSQEGLQQVGIRRSFFVGPASA